jgi:hypothetical protein
MQKHLFIALMALAIFFPPHGPLPIAPRSPPRALILSSTEKQYPMQYLGEVTADLKQAGYNVTFLSGGAITVKLVTTQLDQYDILIWRTDMYILGNTTYWYLGQQANRTTLAADAGTASIRTIDASNGILAVNANFFNNNYGPNSLANVKLAIIIASMSITIAQAFIAAGVRTTIDFFQTLEAPPSLFDWVTQSLMGYLASGSTVSDSIAKTIYNFEYVGSLEDTYLPPISFLGDGNLQLT